HAALPLGTDLGQVIDPDVARAAAVGTVDDHDFRVGQADAWVQIAQGRVIPLRDLTQVDVGQHGPGEAQRSPDARQVGDRAGRAQDQGNVDDVVAVAAGVGELFPVHRGVGAAEVHGPGNHLGDAAAGADGLVIDLGRAEVGVVVGPLAH